MSHIPPLFNQIGSNIQIEAANAKMRNRIAKQEVPSKNVKHLSPE